MRLRGVDDTEAACDHDRLVVATLFLLRTGLTRCVVRNSLFVFAEITKQIRSAKLVVECRAAQRPLNHDLQRAGNVTGLAVGINWNLTPINFRHGKAGQPRFRLGAAPGGALVTNLAASAGGGTGKGRDRGRVIVRLHLHQDMVRAGLFFIATGTAFTRHRGRLRDKALDFHPLHHRSVV